jgi:hypothetical protein
MFQEVVLQKQARLLDEKLKAYERLDGVPTKFLLLWRMRKGGLIAYLRKDSDWRKVSTDFTEFKARPSWWKIWERDAMDDKGVQRIRLRHRGSGAELVLLNTHLQAYGSEYAKIRRHQVGELFSIGSGVDVDLPVIAGGDFNLPPSVLRPLIPSGWSETTADKRRSCGCGTFVGPQGETGYWVDYLFARRPDRFGMRVDVDLIHNRGRDQPWSDHDGVIADFHFRQPPR